jgi:hypothetical protein
MGTALQPFALALMVTVPLIALLDVFVAVNAGTFPFPEAPKPIAVFELDQFVVADAGNTLIVVWGTFPFSHAVISVIAEITGVGLIVIVKFTGVPIHVPMDGVTVTVPEIGAAPPFVPVNAAMFPEPLAANPIDVFVLVHTNVAPTGLLTNVAGEIAPPHCVMFAGTFIVGAGLIVITYVSDVPAHPFRDGVTTILPEMAEPVGFVPTKVGWLPVPVAPNPIAVFELVQVKDAPAGELVNAVAFTLFPVQTLISGLAITVGVGKMEIV